jgi:hypothetical protein
LKESDIQKAIVQYLELMGVYFFSINNEMAGWGKNAMHRTMHFKAMGLRAGASDLVLVLNKKVVFLEIKTPKGRLSENQKTFKTAVEDLGHLYKVARSVQDVEQLLLSLR